MLARGDRDGADDLLKLMLAASQQDETALMNAAMAGYYLKDFPATVAAFEKAPNLEKHYKMGESLHIAFDGSIAAAYAYTQLQQTDRADELVRQIEAMLEKEMKGKTRIHPSIWYRKALLQAIGGNQQMALVNLQRAVDEGWSERWRPYVEPCLEMVLDNGNFQSMMAGLQARTNLMREQLAFEESFRDSWRG